MRFVILFRERRRRKSGEFAIPILDSRFRGNAQVSRNPFSLVLMP